MKIAASGTEWFLKTDISDEDMRLVIAYRPELLNIRENGERGEKIFSVRYSDNAIGSVDNHKICFAQSLGGTLTAYITSTADIPDDKAEHKIDVKAGVGIRRFERIEKQVLEALDDIRKEHERLRGRIEVV